MQWNRKIYPARYIACDVNLPFPSNPRPNNWLISDQIAVQETTSIDITVQYLIASCSTFSGNGGRYCVNVFDLYVNQSDYATADQAKYPNPLQDPAAYENFTQFRRLTNGRNLRTIKFLIKRRYLILAFHNYGACNVLYSVKVSYNVCPQKTLMGSLVSLPRTVAPVNESESIRVEGSCVKDTVQLLGSFHVYCESNGEWSTSGLEGICICKENMQNTGGQCEGVLQFFNNFRQDGMCFFFCFTDKGFVFLPFLVIINTPKPIFRGVLQKQIT